jgi:hypothetical protein
METGANPAIHRSGPFWPGGTSFRRVNLVSLRAVFGGDDASGRRQGVLALGAARCIVAGEKRLALLLGLVLATAYGERREQWQACRNLVATA